MSNTKHDFADLTEAWAFVRAAFDRGDLASDPLQVSPHTVTILETAAERRALAPKPGTYHTSPPLAACRAENQLNKAHGLQPVWWLMRTGSVPWPTD